MTCLEFTRPEGQRYCFQFATPPAVTANVGSVISIGRIINVVQQVVLRDSFRWEPNRSYDAGESVVTDDLNLKRHFTLVEGASNEEGRADVADATDIVNSTIISPATHPYDRNLSGPGLPKGMGPALAFTDLLASGSTKYDRYTVCSFATGNQTLATRATDYPNQRDMPEVMGGIQGNGTRCMMRLGDDYVIWFGMGEGDANSGETTTFAASANAHLATIQADYPGSTCNGIFVARRAPTVEGGSTQANWNIVRSQMASMAAPTGTPPVVVVDYLDSDKDPIDMIHYDAAGHERIAPSAYLAAQQNSIMRASLGIPAPPGGGGGGGRRRIAIAVPRSLSFSRGGRGG